MGKLAVAALVGSIVITGCSAASGAPAPPQLPEPGVDLMTPATEVTPAPPAAAQPPIVRPAPSAKGDPLPDAFIGAWYHSAPAYWWFLRAGSPTCTIVAHTATDCVAYQLGTQAAYVGAAAMDGRLIRIHWTRGYCAGQETDFGTGIKGETLKLFDTEGDCGGDNFVLARAGAGGIPTAPPPPEN